MKDCDPDGNIPAALACSWPALLLATACLLPFLNKPFLIDDAHFLAMARQIVQHPLHPKDFDICWNIYGYSTKAYLLTPGNVLMGYVLVPTILGGAHEWMAHLTQLVLVWIATIAMASLIIRSGWSRGDAVVGTLLLVAIPPFLPMASSAMPDTLATTLALVAMEKLVAWKAERRWGQCAAATIALALAGQARSHLVLLLPLGAFFLFETIEPRKMLEQVRTKVWLWVPVCAGFVLSMAMTLALREPSLVPPPVVIGTRYIPRNLVAFLLYLAFPIPLAASWLANRLRLGRRRTVVIVFAVAAIAALLFRVEWLAVFLSVFGCAAICGESTDAWKRRDHTDIFLLLWILIPLPLIYYSNLPMKYLLPCMPAAILLCFRMMEGVSIPIARAAAMGLIVASTAYSLLILRADADFAEFGRDALSRLIRPHVAAGEKVWFGGQYWSYWYAPLYGATLTVPNAGPQPKPGDLLVVDEFGGLGHPPSDRFPNRTLLQTISHKYQFGRTMGAGAGLYADTSGYWLWAFGDSGRDRYELWRIN